MSQIVRAFKTDSLNVKQIEKVDLDNVERYRVIFPAHVDYVSGDTGKKIVKAGFFITGYNYAANTIFVERVV